MKVAAVQLDVREDESFETRIARMNELVVGQRDVDLIVLPELWPSGGFAYKSWNATAEPLHGSVTSVMAQAAVETGSWLHMGSFVERHPDDSLTNTSVLFAPDGSQQAVYRKIHLFGFGDGEPKLMSAGADIVVAKTPFGVIGLSTCYDLRFPELYRRILDAGGEIVTVPAAWPASRIDHWTLLARARAIENQSIVIAVNTAGTHGGKRMGGRSIVINARGSVLAEAGDDEQVLRAEIDIDDLHEWRKAFPVLPDRRL